MRSFTPFLVGALLLVPMAVTAQERTAGANMSVETSWNALKTLVDNANGRITVLQAAISGCSRNGKLYAPGAPGADAGSCIPLPAGITGVDLSRVQNLGPGHHGGPVLARWSAEAQNLTCPANMVMVGIIARTSGTCENRCNQDGPVIQSLVARCAPLQ